MQLFGTCRPARGRHAAKARRLYGKRFPAYARWAAGLRDGDPGGSYRFYRFRPRRLKVLDEREVGDAVFVVAALRRGRRSRH